MSTIEHVRKTVGAKAAPHYRTTLEALPIVYIVTTSQWQEGHTHYFEDLTRFGDGTCTGCGARAWAPAWVAEGVMGDNTIAWATQQAVGYEARAEECKRIDAMTNLVTKPAPARGLVLVAQNDPNEVAARREGIPVPKMSPLRLV